MRYQDFFLKGEILRSEKFSVKWLNKVNDRGQINLYEVGNLNQVQANVLPKDGIEIVNLKHSKKRHQKTKDG